MERTCPHAPYVGWVSDCVREYIVRHAHIIRQQQGAFGRLCNAHKYGTSFANAGNGLSPVAQGRVTLEALCHRRAHAGPIPLRLALSGG